MNDRKSQVMIVDDHAVVRKGLISLIEDSQDLQVAGEAASVADALKLSAAVRIDLALIDMRLPDGDGLDLVGSIKANLPGMKTIILTAYPHPHLTESALQHGVDGVLLKTIDGESILMAIAAVLEGRTYIDPALVPSVVESLRRKSTAEIGDDTDARILSLLTRGSTNKEIAVSLGLSEKTIRNRLSRIYRRMGIGNRTEAALIESGTFVPSRRD